MRTLYLLLFLCTATIAQAITPTSIDSIPMRDGKKLAADVYLSPLPGTHPTILIQTPYNRIAYQIIGIPLGYGQSMANCPYNFVILDWRCFWGSTAACVVGADRGEDGYDAVQWIAQQPWSDGQVGTWGPSALGRVQFLTAKENPPALKCIAPLVAGPQYNFLEYYPGGVLRTEYLEQLDQLGFGLSPVVMPNQANNLLWQYSESTTQYADSIRIPTLMIGGWYDHTIENMLEFFNLLRTQSPVNVQNQHRLVMGPWVHGGSGPAQVGTANQGQLNYPNAAGWNDSTALDFFDYHLRGINNNWNNTAFVQYYQMGDDQWQNSSTWPPTGLTNVDFYFQNDTSIWQSPPANASGGISYLYDPQNPSPTTGGATLRNDLDQGPYDQAAAVESRSDVLAFTTPVLANDVVLKGKAEVHLSCASDKTDTDFMVRLTDVYPDGRSMLVQTGARRMRFRNGYTPADTSLITPNQNYTLVIDMPATAITFKAGHRIRVDVSSSNYPQFNRNANTGGAMYPGLSPDSLVNPQTALNTVNTNVNQQSFIRLPLDGFIPVCLCLPPSDIISVLPNPSDEMASLYMSLVSDQQVDITITDSHGRLVQHWDPKTYYTGAYHLQLPQHLESGLYFIRITRSNAEPQVLRWIKSK